MTPRRSRGRRLVLAAAAAVVLVLAGCSEVKNNGQNSLAAEGSRRPRRSTTSSPRSWSSRSSSASLIIIATVVLARASSATAPGKNENPKQIHGNTQLEIGWTIIPALLLADRRGAHGRAPSSTWPRTPGPSALQVTVEGKQWWWQFDVPRTDARSSPPTSCIIPTGRDVYVHLNACDGTGDRRTTCNVIHSFWVPELAGKKDVVPGHDNTHDALGRQTGHLPRAVRGVLRAVARQHALPGDRQEPRRLPAVARRAAAGPGEPAVRGRRHHAGRRRPRS